VPDRVRVTSVEFDNFKAFRRFTLGIQQVNILVGPNNSGKSTILGSFRVLAEGLRRGRARSPERVTVRGRAMPGYSIPREGIPISLENVHTDYSDEDSSVTFKLSNGNTVELYFPREGGCYLIPPTESGYVRSKSDFKREVPVTLVTVPVLGPVEHEEPIVEPETVRLGLNTHRASRHFRNYWHLNQDGFDEFAALVARTWPGMEIERPSRPDSLARHLVMFAREQRMTRELYWSGFGFQVWCQLLSHIARAGNDTLLIVDEPEIYLHPDVQRQLLSILREAGPDIVVATHSTEIIGEAEPAELLVIDKTKRSAQRLKSVHGVQGALNALGSLQNFTLTQLARTRRVVFVEGLGDFKILRRFAQRLGYLDVASGTSLTAVESGGLGSRDRINGTAWGIEKVLGGTLAVAAIFDRDYMPEEEVASMRAALGQNLKLLHVHARKEIENYLLEPTVVERALIRAVRERGGDVKAADVPAGVIRQMLEQLSEPLKTELQAQYVARRSSFLARDPRGAASIATETLRWFEERWKDMDTRMAIAPGKTLLSSLRAGVQERWQVNLTDARIVAEFRRDEVPADLQELIRALDAYRAGKKP
jgi:predicted ATPase